jgi:hypothetical protein
LTGTACVDMIVTELCVFQVDKKLGVLSWRYMLCYIVLYVVLYCVICCAILCCRYDCHWIMCISSWQEIRYAFLTLYVVLYCVICCVILLYVMLYVVLNCVVDMIVTELCVFQVDKKLGILFSTLYISLCYILLVFYFTNYYIND